MLVLLCRLFPQRAGGGVDAIGGVRWSFRGNGDAGMETSLAVALAFLLVCLAAGGWIFRPGYRLKS